MDQKHFLLFLSSLIPASLAILGNIPHKYDLIMTMKSWSNAQNYCRGMYSDLATVISDDDWLRLKKEAASKNVAASAWVGLYDDYTSWRWSLNELSLKKTLYTNWDAGQPNNALALEACVMISTNGKWLDTSCKFLRAIICYNASFSGPEKFIGNKTLVNWFEAQAYCRTYHTDLASSINSSDQTILAQLRNIQGDSWLGLYRDTWKWSDGTNTSTIRWALGQPDNSERIMGSCASVNNGVLSDEPCTNLHYFFCHTIPPVRSIIKLQVKSNRSGFDPTVQSSILDLLKLLLEQKHMLDATTVTWRVQPDGNIFYKKKDEHQNSLSDCDNLNVQFVYNRERP